ncbi:uncharacterized protein N7446_001378 [Penicillium canescens]|uniref:Uncharacterized protein n=1 Tax=Penicillium canescens TaxID=5083 RepID=A0AAD6N8T3_PENCN|nr:uncharacterized protein N7446_001378 [Penicillium canescens]KAJ6043182.1 hypothetical protein N7460_004537 [Penicillium canescens]KAJ6054657.1 hypothetical protein N7444_003755 [Penicillium canescens]KAJ6073601.1 hypothetical protein N7446_001378 [Penicillium canescens]
MIIDARRFDSGFEFQVFVTPSHATDWASVAHDFVSATLNLIRWRELWLTWSDRRGIHDLHAAPVCAHGLSSGIFNQVSSPLNDSAGILPPIL